MMIIIPILQWARTLQLSYAAGSFDEPQAHEAHLSDDPKHTRVKKGTLILEK